MQHAKPSLIREAQECMAEALLHVDVDMPTPDALLAVDLNQNMKSRNDSCGPKTLSKAPQTSSTLRLKLARLAVS